MAVLNHKLLRDLLQSKGQVLAVLAVIASGIAVFGAFYSCYHNLLLTRDSYYTQLRFHDLSLQFEKAPQSAVFRVGALPGVREARGRIVKDVNLSLAGEEDNKIARLISQPPVQAGMIDGIQLVNGRQISPEAVDEAVVEQKFFAANHLKLGDRLSVKVQGKLQSLKIVGTAQSPEYVYTIRNAQEMIPNPKTFAVVWVQQAWAESQLNLGGAVNEIVAVLEDPEQAQRLLDQAADLLKSYGLYGKTTRKQQLSNWYLDSELTNLEAAAKVTPVIFMLIAALILLILLSRMIQRERNQIGLLKAFGYRNSEIALHYFKFAGLIGLVGGLAGYGLGQWMGQAMFNLMVTYFSFPLLRTGFYPGLLGLSLAIGIGTALASAALVVKSVVSISPASAMRESPPVTASKTPLEAIPALWRRLSFTNKLIFRNIFRYPLRASFSVLGVTLATAILMMGYYKLDAIDAMLAHQYGKVQLEDMRVNFYLERGFDALYDMQRLPHVLRAEPELLEAFELKAGWKRKTMLVTGLPDQMRLFGLLDQQGQPIKLDSDGLILMTQTAKELGLQVGDSVSLKPLIGRIDREQSVRVDKITTQYVGTGAYMRLSALSHLLDEPRVLNAALLKVESGHNQEINRRLKDIPAVAAVEVKQDSLANFQKILSESSGTSNFFTLLFAGVIAVAVIYNSTAISITERRHEMASLRVLGYTTQEVGRIVFNENLGLSLLGLGLGLWMGTSMCAAISQTVETEVYRLPFVISQQTYLVTSTAILCFVGISNWLSRKRIVSIDMVEALKSRE